MTMTLKLYQAFSCFSGRFKRYICSQENRMGDSLGTWLMHVQNIYILMHTKIAPTALLQTLSVQLL